MEKRELHEAHSPILKPVPEESSALSSNTSSNTPSSPPPSEERKVTFNIGDSDDPDQKESETGNGKSECDASHAMPDITHT